MPASKLQTIKALRYAFPPTFRGLQEAKEFVEGATLYAPAVVAIGLDRDAAERSGEELRAAGARVEVVAE